LQIDNRADQRVPISILIFTLLFLLLVQGYPFIWSIVVSFRNQRIGGGGAFVGLGNYFYLVKSPAFWRAISFTVIYVSSAIIFKLIFGFVMATALNQPLKGRAVFRALLFLPWALPTLTSVMAWRWMLGDIGGIFNFLLTQTGLIDRPIGWLGDPEWARLSVIIVNVWRGTPFFGISILAGLQGIDPNLYEAASIDGAGSWRKFWSVTIPSIRPVVLLVTLVSTIWTLGDFTIIWIMTRGGPANATHVFSTLSYITSFQNLYLSRGVAISMSIVPASLLLMFLAMRYIFSSDGESK
jgi:multiple sugar transport system permease protein